MFGGTVGLFVLAGARNDALLLSELFCVRDW